MLIAALHTSTQLFQRQQLGRSFGHLGGGFGVVTKNFHVALLLLLLAFGFSVAWMRPNVMKLVRASEQSPIDRAAADRAVGKLGMGSGILHALWLVILILMFYRF